MQAFSWHYILTGKSLVSTPTVISWDLLSRLTIFAYVYRVERSWKGEKRSSTRPVGFKPTTLSLVLLNSYVFTATAIWVLFPPKKASKSGSFKNPDKKLSRKSFVWSMYGTFPPKGKHHTMSTVMTHNSLALAFASQSRLIVSATRCCWAFVCFEGVFAFLAFFCMPSDTHGTLPDFPWNKKPQPTPSLPSCVWNRVSFEKIKARKLMVLNPTSKAMPIVSSL